MKKLSTALLAAGLTLSASACVAHPQLTTPETCERIASVLSSPSVNIGNKTGAIRLGNQIRTIEPVSSDDLKPTLQTLLELTDESAKDAPDVEKQTELQGEFGSSLSEFCPRS